MSDTPSRFRIGDQVIVRRGEYSGLLGRVVDIHHDRIIVVMHGQRTAHYWDYEADHYEANTESVVQPNGYSLNSG